MNLIDKRTPKAAIFAFRETKVECAPAGSRQVVWTTGGGYGFSKKAV